MFKQEKGMIGAIATVIIMIVLMSAITISTSLNGSIFEKAQSASDKWENTTQSESFKMY